ncbi:NAD(P)/FAD-dependent oxidoreductase [Propionibacteriaceae bacterium G57]|uniref:NAD(P)/FAD-dependent oxidoreductase n=1 Tax=Aestuariimicrobium sp. G57 TaxID=3418485 RepID=UPI003DA74915
MSHLPPPIRRMGMDDVIVIGAGYAGLMAANRLAPHARVRLVDPRTTTVDRIRLHQLTAGTRAVTRTARPLGRALDRRVVHTRARATRIEPGVVHLADGGQVRAGHILLAHGRAAARPGSMDTLEGALDLRGRLESAAPGTTVAVVGAGLTGLELATELAESRPQLRVRLVAREPVGGGLLPAAAAHVRRVLDGLGVQVVDGPMGSDIVVDQTGLRPEPLGEASGLALDATGRIRTDRYLRVLGADGDPVPGVFGAGDAIAVDGLPWLREGCASATPLGASAADRIRAELSGRALRLVNVGFLFRCISLGRREAVVQFVGRDDRLANWWLGGRAAVLMKEAISTYAGLAPFTMGRMYFWPGAPRGTVTA